MVQRYRYYLKQKPPQLSGGLSYPTKDNYEKPI